MEEQNSVADGTPLPQERALLWVGYYKCPITAVGSNGRCNTIWYKAVFKGGVL